MPISGLDATQLVLDFNNKYRAGIINMGMMNRPLYKKRTFDSLFVDIYTDNTVIDQVNIQESGRFQQFQDVLLPLGGMKFTPNEIPLTHIMLDTALSPQKIAGTAIDFLADQNMDRANAPIVAIWLMSILDSAMDNFHKNETFFGVKSAITQGTPTAEGATINGIKKILEIARANTSAAFQPHVIQPAVTVPTDDAEFVDYVEEFWSSLPKEIQDLALPIAMSTEAIEKYKRGLIAKYQSGGWNKLGYNVDMDSLTEKIYARKGTILGVSDMDGSDKIWLTVKGNAIRGLKNSNNMDRWKVGEKDLKLVQATKDYWIGYGFLNYDWVYENAA